MTLTQTAPDPIVLRELVDELVYKPGWTITLEDVDRGQGSQGLTLCVLARTPDSYHPERARCVIHYFIVPAAAYNERSWKRWLFDRLVDVETHECCEFLQLGGVRPFAPNHGPGNDPHMVVTLGTAEEADTSFRGERLHPQLERVDL